MNYSGEAADQVVRMTIHGTEVALRLTGAAAERLAILIYSIMKDQHRTAGKMRLGNMLKSGKELNVFTIPEKDLSAFAAEAKKYGVLYCALKEKTKEGDGTIDVMVNKEDAAKINRIVERISLATVEAEKVPEAQKKKENPRSEPISQIKENSGEGTHDRARRSVRKDLEDLRAKRKVDLPKVAKEKARRPHMIDKGKPPENIPNGRAR